MNQVKNIILINPGQFGYKAGYYYYAKYLSRYDEYIVTVLCFDQGLPKVDIPKVKVEYIDFCGSKSQRLLRWLMSVKTMYDAHSDKSSIFFMSRFNFCFVFPLLFPKAKKILDIRTGSVSRKSMINWLQNKQYKFESHFFSVISIISKGLSSQLGLNGSKCHWLPLGSDVLSKTNKEFKSLKIIYVGTFDGRRIHETIEGLSIFLSKNSRLNLQVSYDIFGFGDDKQVQLINNTLNKCELKGIVKYHGRKNHFELKSYYDSCNIGISYVPVTKYYENQPVTKTFEYILAGMVCVATSTYENKKIINGANGILCDDTPLGFAEALDKIVMNKHNYCSTIIRGTLIDYTWERIVERRLKPLLEKVNA